MIYTISRDKAINLIYQVRNIGRERLLFQDDLNLEDEVDAYCQGVSNGFLSEIINAITGYKVEVIGNVENLFNCPCCGFKTLTELYGIDEGGWDICSYCNWEDDGTIEENKHSSVNRGSINEYRDKMRLNPNKYYIDKWFV